MDEILAGGIANAAQTDDALASVARLLRRFHDASARVSAPYLAGPWSDAFSQSSPGASTICHFDVCLENVVFREGNAIAFLDFDFAAPGNPLDDVASFAASSVGGHGSTPIAANFKTQSTPRSVRAASPPDG